MAHQGKLQSLALTTDAVSSRRLPSTRLTDRAALLAGKGSFANVGDWKDEKLAEERKKGNSAEKGLNLAGLTRSPHWRCWAVGYQR
jgi:hypothetical protein